MFSHKKFRNVGYLPCHVTKYDIGHMRLEKQQKKI